jgi:ABC-type enterochelin transport system permease subunit
MKREKFSFKVNNYTIILLIYYFLISLWFSCFILSVFTLYTDAQDDLLSLKRVPHKLGAILYTKHKMWTLNATGCLTIVVNHLTRTTTVSNWNSSLGYVINI